MMISRYYGLKRFAIRLWSGCFVLCILLIVPTADADDKGIDGNGHAGSVITGRVADSSSVKAAPVQELPEERSQSEDQGLALTSEQWDAARSGDEITQLPAVRTVVNAWLKDRTQQIEIRYPGGEEGEFWVHELTDWLISLGIPSDKLIRSPGSGAADVIRLQLSRAN
jgi:hypothetical protein